MVRARTYRRVLNGHQREGRFVLERADVVCPVEVPENHTTVLRAADDQTPCPRGGHGVDPVCMPSQNVGPRDTGALPRETSQFPEANGRVFHARDHRFTIGKCSTEASCSLDNLCDFSVDVEAYALIGRAPMNGFVRIKRYIEHLLWTLKDPIAERVDCKGNHR